MAGIMTIVEANVPEDDWAPLWDKWQETSRERPSQMVHSWLFQGLDGSETWCAVTLWQSEEALDEYRASLAPGGLEMFRALNADPALAVLDVMAESHGDAANAGVVTIFEASLPGEDWPALEATWKKTSADTPEQAVKAWLLRDVDNPDTWCALTLWKNRDALEDYQSSSAELLPGNVLFQSLGVMPLLAGFEVVAEG